MSVGVMEDYKLYRKPEKFYFSLFFYFFLCHEVAKRTFTGQMTRINHMDHRLAHVVRPEIKIVFCQHSPFFRPRVLMNMRPGLIGD
jgi:hypothetical protein